MLITLAALALAPSRALAWGDYGHELVQVAVLQLLAEQKHAVMKLATPNAALLRRLANVPDEEWQKTGQVTKQRKPVSFKQEPPLHYFAADAFARVMVDPEAIVKLPSDSSFAAAAPRLETLLKANVDFTRSFAVSGQPLAEFGTTPWRILQMYDLAVSSLREKNFKFALLYLAALGHYVADMAQPFHVTLNFNGEVYPVPAEGVHPALEETMIDQAVSANDGKIQEEILKAAIADLGPKGIEGLPRARVLPEILKLVSGSYVYVDPLLRAYSEQCTKVEGALAYCEKGGAEPPATLVKAFAAAVLKEDTERGIPESTVLAMAERRMGVAALLIARLWTSAYTEAKSPLVPADAYKASDIDLVAAYPQPTYLPAK
jgi:hypothetical protein